MKRSATPTKEKSEKMEDLSQDKVVRQFVHRSGRLLSLLELQAPKNVVGVEVALVAYSAFMIPKVRENLISKLAELFLRGAQNWNEIEPDGAAFDASALPSPEQEMSVMKAGDQMVETISRVMETADTKGFDNDEERARFVTEAFETVGEEIMSDPTLRALVEGNSVNWIDRGEGDE